jgi:hypothetical protein
MITAVLLLAYICLSIRVAKNADFRYYGDRLVDEAEGYYVDIYLDIPRQYHESYLKEKE